MFWLSIKNLQKFLKSLYLKEMRLILIHYFLFLFEYFCIIINIIFVFHKKGQNILMKRVERFEGVKSYINFL